jgi:hypothetical protein
MTLTPEEITALQERAARAEELEQRLAAVDGKKGEILDEKRQLRQQLEELQGREDARKKKELEEQGRTAELLERERKEKEELQKQIAEKDQAIQQAEEQRIKDRLRADFVAGVGSEAFAPMQLWALFQSAVQDKDGKTVVLFRGAEVTPGELAGKLRNDAEYAHHLKPRGAGGMGSRPASGDPIEVSGNPYLPGGNVTQRIMLELDNPDLAAKLKAEAAAAASKG